MSNTLLWSIRVKRYNILTILFKLWFYKMQSIGKTFDRVTFLYMLSVLFHVVGMTLTSYNYTKCNERVTFLVVVS